MTLLKCATMDRLKSVREAKGMSRRQLAEATGLGERTIAYIENGTKSPRVENAVKIARALGVSLLDLLGDTAA